MKVSEEIFNITFQKRIPLYTTIEITYKCNLNCIHCYLPEYYKTKKTMTTEKIKNVIKQIKNLGGLYIVFTGGEPLIREDIFDLIKYAKGLNFVVLLFTNGTLIDEKVAQKLKFSGVDKVEISFYGREIVHNSITLKNDSYKKVVCAIRYLKKEGINTAIKCPIMEINYDEYVYLQEFAKNNCLETKFDFVLVPKNDGDSTPQKYMISQKKIKDFLQKIKFNHKKSLDLISNLICSAGRNIVGITADGKVYPCLQFSYKIGDLNNQTFKQIWFSKKFEQLNKQNIDNYVECKSCDLVSVCNRCPGVAYVETKNFYMCSFTAKRLAKVVQEI